LRRWSQRDRQERSSARSTRSFELINDPLIAQVIGHPNLVLHMSDVMDQRKIFIVRVSIADLG